MEELRSYQWLDQFCDADVRISVESADEQARSELEEITTNLSQTDLEVAQWNEYVEQLGRLRVLGNEAEKLFKLASA